MKRMFRNQLCADSLAFSNGDHLGLTKRELFAAMAMQSLLQADYRHGNEGFGYTLPDQLAGIAVGCAEALLKKLGEE